MPVLGAVIHLGSDPLDRNETLDWLSSMPGVTVGATTDNRLPVALSSDSRAEDKALWTALSALPGVSHLQLCFADFSDLHEEGTPS